MILDLFRSGKLPSTLQLDVNFISRLEKRVSGFLATVWMHLKRLRQNFHFNIAGNQPEYIAKILSF